MFRVWAACVGALLGVAVTVAAQPDPGALAPGLGRPQEMPPASAGTAGEPVHLGEALAAPEQTEAATKPVHVLLVFNPYVIEVKPSLEPSASAAPAPGIAPLPNPYLAPPPVNPYTQLPHPGVELSPFFNPYASVGEAAPDALRRARQPLAASAPPAMNPYAHRRADDPDLNPYMH